MQKLWFLSSSGKIGDFSRSVTSRSKFSLSVTLGLRSLLISRSVTLFLQSH